MEGTWISIVPPLIAITLWCLLTKRVLVSLGSGILAGVLLTAALSPH